MNQIPENPKSFLLCCLALSILKAKVSKLTSSLSDNMDLIQQNT